MKKKHARPGLGHLKLSEKESHLRGALEMFYKM